MIEGGGRKWLRWGAYLSGKRNQQLQSLPCLPDNLATPVFPTNNENVIIITGSTTASCSSSTEREAGNLMTFKTTDLGCRSARRNSVLRHSWQASPRCS